jgi:hypothetical protein
MDTLTTQMSNADIESVSEGISSVLNKIQDYNKGEQMAIVTILFNAIVEEHNLNLTDVIWTGLNIEKSAKEQNLPEITSARRYIKNEFN